MNRLFLSLTTLLLSSFFISCNKETTLLAEEPIAPGEFYIKATVNGVPHYYANDVDGYKLEGSFGSGMGITMGALLSARGANFRQCSPNTGKECHLLFQDSVADHITELAGKTIPFCIAGSQGFFINRHGAVLRFHDKETWEAGSNYNSALYNTRIISVTPYKKGSYGRIINQEYFKVTLQFQCKVLGDNGEEDVTSGEAVTLVGRNK
jgi:hypothetical protein